MKVCLAKAIVFPLVMHGCECWSIKKAECWRTDAFKLVLEKTLESPLDFCKKIKPVNPKGNQSWIFIGRIDAKAPILWSPDVKRQLIIKDPDAWKDRKQKEKGTIEDEGVGWHHQLNEHESEQAPRDSEGQGSLACCSPWGCRVGHDWGTEQPLCFRQILFHLSHQGSYSLVGPSQINKPQALVQLLEYSQNLKNQKLSAGCHLGHLFRIWTHQWTLNKQTGMKTKPSRVLTVAAWVRSPRVQWCILSKSRHMYCQRKAMARQ